MKAGMFIGFVINKNKVSFMINKNKIFLFGLAFQLLNLISLNWNTLHSSNLSTGMLDYKISFYHILKSIDLNRGIIILTDGSSWHIKEKNSESSLASWQKGDRLKISYNPNQPSNMKIYNIDNSNTAWGLLKSSPKKNECDKILYLSSQNEGTEGNIILRSGLNFTFSASSLVNEAFISWEIDDSIFIFHNEENYDLCNITKKNWIKNCLLTSKIEDQKYEVDILKLESQLNQYVLAQNEATHAISNALIKYKAGLNNPETPIGVFLFLGPSGVGKTELAKTLAREYYKSVNKLIRFDMSQFNESHSSARLIGSPPGYVNHEEGGQLTEALKINPQSLILLDEIDKAHPFVRKLFLPVFDEGYITDSQDTKILCREAIFIMTSNLASQEISNLFDLCYEPHEVLERIEPIIMQELSPELYNRVQPILFRPLNKEIMVELVNLRLKEVTERLLKNKNIHLIVDQSARDYLVEHGYHPSLGARPLIKLIENKVTNTLAYALVSQAIPSGSTVTLFYHWYNDEWMVEF